MKNGVLKFGDMTGQEVSKRAGGTFATTTLLKVMGARGRHTGMIVAVEADNSMWMWDADSTASASGTVLIPDDTPAAGRWVSLVATPVPSDTDPLVDGAAAVAGSNAQYARRDHVHPDSMGAGTCTLVAGTVTVTDARVVATSRVSVTRNLADTCTLTTGGYQVTKTTGSFTVIACVAAGTINVADVSTLDYVVKY